MSLNATHPPASSQHGSPYGYDPTFGVCVTFVGLFGLSTLIHTAQAIYSRLWWLLATAVCCGIGETIGWSGRLWSSQHPVLRTPFLMQISSTIMSPTFLVAANFVILALIIRLIGPQFSRLKPFAYAAVFLTADCVALIVQAVGGAQASAADTLDGANRGAKVMLGGILFQFVAIIVYVTLASEFFLRVYLNKPVRPGPAPSPIPRSVKLMILGLGTETLFILIRTIYRTIELNDGWTGRIITTQLYFNVLDGAPIVIAMYTLNLLHPGWLLPRSVPKDVVDESSSQEADKEV